MFITALQKRKCKLKRFIYLPWSHRVEIQTQLSNSRASALNQAAKPVKGTLSPRMLKNQEIVLPPFCRWKNWGPSPVQDHSLAWLRSKALSPVPGCLLNLIFPLKIILFKKNVRPRDCHAEWSKSDIEGQISYITYMWNLKKKGTNELTYKTEVGSQR